MTTFTWIPDYPVRPKKQASVLSGKFGDGYEQRAADGINSIRREVALVFKNRTAAEIAAIDAFLTARNGVESFSWTPPNGAAGKWVCDSWETPQDTPVYLSLSATFREVFEP